MVTWQKGSYGEYIQIRFWENGAVKDLTTFTTKVIRSKSPSGTVTSHTAVFTANSGSDGIIRYQRTSGDFDTAGVWEFQGQVDDGGTNLLRTSPGQITIVDFED